MTAQLIDGKAIAQKVRDEVAERVAKRIAAGKSQPTLATVFGGRPAGFGAYVSSKASLPGARDGLGQSPPPADATQEQVETVVKQLNSDRRSAASLCNFPCLPPQRRGGPFPDRYREDVDGFSPLNIGRLAQKGRERFFVPCTPYGCIYLLEQVV